jgi:hypothetical protein
VFDIMPEQNLSNAVEYLLHIRFDTESGLSWGQNNCLVRSEGLQTNGSL